jgi:hypothetical protein
MQCKHLCVIVLVIQVLSVFQAKGQEQRKDSIAIPHSLQNKKILQPQPAQPSSQEEMPGLYNRINNDLKGISVGRNVASSNFNQELKYSIVLARDSSFFHLPEYPGLGDYQNFGGKLGNFNITNKLALDYGAFVSVQYGYLFSTKQIVFGSNYLLRTAITKKIQLQTWGKYVTPGNSSDPTFSMRSFFPKTNFGAGLQYDSNKKAKIKVGIEYQYDQSDKTWKPESGGKVLFGF